MDFQTPAGEGAALPQPQGQERAPRSAADFRSSYHLSPANVLVLPHQTLQELGGTVRSVAVRFEDAAAAQPLTQDLLLRLGLTLFAGRRPAPGQEIAVSSYTSLGTTSIQGISALAVPILIGALIILNAMLGAVYERSREIGIYSSVGLAPVHIALLFVAEALVYAVLGVTLGYLLGQGLGRVLAWAGVLGAVTLNYSSMAAVFSCVLVMAVVFLSTWYPARLAARSAVPDVMRRWRPPPPGGDRWEFRFPFMVGRGEVLGICGFLYNLFDGYRDESIGTYYVRQVRVVQVGSGDGREYALQLLLWLAPFDMGVSQYTQIEFVPTETPQAHAIELFIQRLSGQHSSWQRVNHAFVNRLRRELLIWHTLREDARSYHRETARRVLEEEEAG